MPHVMNARSSLKKLLLAATITIAAVATPSVSSAQATDAVYAGSDLDTPPKLSSMTQTSRLVQASYPAELRRAGINGMVQIQFVVDAHGKVEPSSIEVLDASLPALGDAAKDVVAKIEFHPGKVKGQAVRSRVMLPIVYKAR